MITLMCVPRCTSVYLSKPHAEEKQNQESSKGQKVHKGTQGTHLEPSYVDFQGVTA